MVDQNDSDNRINEPHATMEKTDLTETSWEDMLGSGSILRKVVKEGNPNTKPTRSQICEINYQYELEDGTLIIKEDGFLLQLGDCEVIQGLDLAIGLMNVGDIWELKIVPRLAYGEKGLEPNIPSDTTILCKVELVSVKDEDDPENLTISQRKKIGNKKRERGNWWYGRGENTIAIQCYRRALDYLDDTEYGMKHSLQNDQNEVTDGDLQDILEDRLSVYNNMAAAQIKLEMYDAALKLLETVLRCQPHNVKALFRKAKIFRAKYDYMSAYKFLQKASAEIPNDTDIIKEMSSITALIRRQKISEKELAQRMISSGSKKNPSKDKKIQWGLIMATVAVGVLAIAAYKFKYI